MLLVDKRATETSKSSLFLTREEFKEIYPHRLNSRLNYIFYNKKPKEVDKKEAKLLLKKYSHLLKWEPDLGIVKTDRHKELEKLDYYKLKKTGTALGMSFKEITIKREVLIDRIVTKELEKKGDEGTK